MISCNKILFNSVWLDGVCVCARMHTCTWEYVCFNGFRVHNDLKTKLLDRAVDGNNA